MELRDHGDAQAWIAAGLCLSRLATIDESREFAAPWLLEAVSETGRIPPPGVVLDFGRLFSGVPLRRAVPLPTVGAPLRAALRSYEDHVLGRLESSAELDRVIDAFAPLSDVIRARAVAVLVASIASRLGTRGVAVSPGVLRRVVASSSSELVGFASEALSGGVAAAEWLTEGYQRITERAHRASKLLTEADVFVVENIAALGDLTQRLAISEILAVSEERRRALPKRIKARKRPAKRQVMTSLLDEDHYPTGGFSSISTSGTMENLVISELIYMEDSVEGGVDLFDLRYAEGELLYYTRDESQFVRDHRAIGIVLASDLARARIKDRGARHQRVIELLATIHCSVGRLSEWLSEQALHIAIFTVDEDGSDELGAERALLEVLFATDIERGLVSIGHAPSLAAALATDVGDPRAVPQWLAATSAQTPPDAPESTLLRVGSIPRLDDRDLASWDEAALELLSRLV